MNTTGFPAPTVRGSAEKAANGAEPTVTYPVVVFEPRVLLTVRFTTFSPSVV